MTVRDPAAASSRLTWVEEAITGFGRGEFVIVFDGESRENEGDLMVAAEHPITGP